MMETRRIVLGPPTECQCLNLKSTFPASTACSWLPCEVGRDPYDHAPAQETKSWETDSRPPSGGGSWARAGSPRAAQAWSEGPWSARGPGTCSAIVATDVELIQAPAVLDRELVVVGEGGLLTVAHVHAQFVAALGRDPVYVVQPCGDSRGCRAWPGALGNGTVASKIRPGEDEGYGEL